MRCHRLPGLALGVVLLAGCCGSEAPPPRTAVAMDLDSRVVRLQDASREQAWDGVVEAVHQATVSAQTAGRVVELPYDVNDTVPQGAVIVRFTDVEQKSAHTRAQAQIAAAQAAYDEANASYARVAAIAARGLVARQQLDQERARRDAALATLQAAQAQMREVGQQLDYTVVRAPYAGIVTRRFVQIGESVQPGQPLMAGVSLTDLRVTVQVPQSAVAAIRRQDHAEVLLDDGAHRVAATRLTVFPYADPDTHTFSVRLELPGENTGLYPGMTVKVAFAVGRERRLLVPASALVQRGELQGIYVLGQGAPQLRQVRTGARYGAAVEVIAGLDDGERIAVDPAAAARWIGAHRGEAAP
ncbi:efflux RND transporter periplasmic adaptor subunit [Frateuria terrea]|uniref:RND family efflux transporter, MFP subunit n=1 Tax=Frateuria terrea TaxID=529704 RepID=A0A1H6UU69_9GAMM|nr:efflux RND transporter periplasmic adaptor subunit [Frateuria terrea]SEI94214.1 RND family efflux transporter, MFP subunit [Frateuria terrea]SFP34184.1 RND family efflux transporter, MFP subunit [Frateuria terrea]